MNVELKKIRIFAPLSRETVCFTAEVYIDGYHAAHASNDGHGGCNNIYNNDVHGRSLVLQAEQYFALQSRLPIIDPATNKPFMFGDIEATEQPSLDTKIDELLVAYCTAKDQERFNQKLAKDMPRGVCVGQPGKSYLLYAFKVPIAEMFAGPVRREALVRSILDLRRRGKINNTDLRILNTNIPQDLIDQTL